MSNGNGGAEQAMVLAHATVMIYDDQNKKWYPAGNGPTGIAKVYIYQHSANNTFRVVGRKVQDFEVVINCAIQKGLKYNQATPTFHQWRDNRQVYGLNFAGKDDANAFASAMAQAVECLKDQAPPVARFDTGSSNPNNTYGYQQQQQQYGNGSSHGLQNGDDHELYGRGNYVQVNEDHYSPVQKESHYRPEYQSSNSVTYGTASNTQQSQVNDARDANGPTYTTTVYTSQQRERGSIPNIPPHHLATVHPVASAPSLSTQVQDHSPPAHQTVPPRAPPLPTTTAPPVPAAAAAPPPPPPPPVFPVNPGGGAQGNPLANALQNAQLRKTSTVNGINGGSTGSVNSTGSAGGGGKIGLISEMQATLARRRAKQDRAGEDSGDGITITTKSAPLSGGERKASTWEKSENGPRTLPIGKTSTAVNVNGTGTGPESPKAARKGSNFSVSQDSTDLSRLSSTVDSEGLVGELERFKQELLAEMRREFNEMKMDLIKSVRQELSNRR